MKLSIIIPVYNEKATILKLLDKVENVDIGMDREIIIVDDCSTDGTRDSLKNITKHKIFYHDSNKGKGSAIRTALKHVTGDIVLIQDADLEYKPEEYPLLLKPIMNGNADVVYGSRMLMKNKKIKYIANYIGNMLISLLATVLFFRRVTDMETCYKVMKTDVIKSIKLKSTGFEIEPEITAKLLKRGYKIHEVPVSYDGRSIEGGKKIDWKDGLKALGYVIKYRFMD